MTTSSLPRGTWKQRLFAYILAHSEKEYYASMVARKRALMGGLHGSVLEIGPGNGRNLEFFPADVTWTGVEPNPAMYAYIRETLRALGRDPARYSVEPGDPISGRLPAGDGSVDAVVSTLVLCSVPDPDAMLREIRRVLKPGGKFVFIEHVAAPTGTSLRRTQNFLTPVWAWAADGCHINRETGEAISRAGFSRLEMEEYSYPDGWVVAPQVAGVALK